MTKAALKRDEHGRLLAGQASLNPNGRPRKGQGPNVTPEQRLEHDLEAASSLSEKAQAEVEAEAKDKLEKWPHRKRDEYGRFIADGSSSGGRTPIAKGGKLNTLTLARTHIANNIHRVINKLIEQGEHGDTAASKILMDRYLPILKATEITGGLDINTLPRMIVQAHGEVIDVEALDENNPETSEKHVIN